MVDFYVLDTSSIFAFTDQEDGADEVERLLEAAKQHECRLDKDAIVKLKDEGKVLLRIAELKQQLDMRLPGEQFSLNELRAVVGLLAGPGVVWQLGFGDFVPLQPERINAYAAAVTGTSTSTYSAKPPT